MDAPKTLQAATDQPRDDSEAPFEMANLFPKHTGLPFVVWISMKGRAMHNPRIRVSANVHATPNEMISADTHPYGLFIHGQIDDDKAELLKVWVELNRDTMRSYWEGEIDTQDALE